MRVEKLLKRLRREFIKVNLLQAVLDTLVFFLLFNFVFFLLSLQLVSKTPNLHVISALSVFFLLGDLFYRTRKYRLEIYEEKNPELEEILRTARDNLDSQNIVSQALFDELLDRARKVTSDSIIPSKRIIQKILAIGVISFLTVLSGIFGFQIQEDGGEILPELGELEQIAKGKSGEKGFELKNTSSIYGDREDIDASDLDISFNITGSGEAEETTSRGARVQQELLLDVSSRSLNDDLELAKKYSLAIKQFE